MDGSVVATFTSATRPATASGLRMDVVNAPVGRHLPALDGIQEVVRVEAADLDEIGERRLNVTRLVRAPRLKHGLAPVPPPGEPESNMGEAEHGLLQGGLAPRPAAVGGD